MAEYYFMVENNTNISTRDNPVLPYRWKKEKEKRVLKTVDDGRVIGNKFF